MLAWKALREYSSGGLKGLENPKYCIKMSRRENISMIILEIFFSTSTFRYEHMAHMLFPKNLKIRPAMARKTGEKVSLAEQ